MWNEATDDGLLSRDLSDLGTRVLRAARLAVAAHLYESVAQTSSIVRQRVVIGGAGPSVVPSGGHCNDPCVTEDALPVATAGVVETHQSRRPSRGVGGPFGGPGTPSPEGPAEAA